MTWREALKRKFNWLSNLSKRNPKYKEEKPNLKGDPRTYKWDKTQWGQRK